MPELGDGIFTIPGFIDAAECAELIRRSEQVGYAPATVVTADGARVVNSIRNNARVIEENFDRAASLWSRVRTYIPPFVGPQQAIGVNERFRFYRYDPGERFAGHIDAPFRRENGETSLLTFMIYLNDSFTGGETAFHETTVVPEPGMALLFRHDRFHEGSAVTKGRKYVLRTDVMFNPPGRISG